MKFPFPKKLTMLKTERTTSDKIKYNLLLLDLSSLNETTENLFN